MLDCRRLSSQMKRPALDYFALCIIPYTRNDPYNIPNLSAFNDLHVLHDYRLFISSLSETINQLCSTVQPPTTSSNFQSTSIPSFLKIARASSAISSKPPVARAKIVGPAPERQIPRSPGCVAGVILEVTSGSPGICSRMSLNREVACG